MAIMDFLSQKGPDILNAVGGFGEALQSIGQGRASNMQPYMDEAKRLRQQRSMAQFQQGIQPYIAGMNPQQQGILKEIMRVNPNAGMGILAGQAFPSPSDPYGHYMKVGQSLVDLRGEKPSVVYESPEAGNRYYAVSTSQGYLLVDKRTGSSRMLGSPPKGVPVVDEQGRPASPSGAQTYRAPSADPALQGQITSAKEGAKREAEFQELSPAQIQNARDTLKVLQDFGGHPGFESIYGSATGLGIIPNDMLMNRPGGDAANAQPYLDQIGGKSFLQAYQDLRGGGQITEIEGQKATAAISRLGNTRQSPESARQALQELVGIVNRGLERLQTKAAVGAAAQPQGSNKPLSEMSMEELMQMRQRLGR